MLHCRPLAILALLFGTLMSNTTYGQGSWWSTPWDTNPGMRQRQHSGKVWPPEPRDCGPCQPLTHTFHHTHYWPYPYTYQDRNTVRAFTNVQRDAGWIDATTMYDQHFDPITNELNTAGRSHLRWILTLAPPSRRTPWVQAADSVELSQSRLASVQQNAVAILGSDPPPVLLRVTNQTGTAAQDAYEIRRQYLNGFPSPRLPLSLNQGTGSGSSSSSSSGSSGGK